MNLLAGALGALINQVDSFIRKDLFSVLLPGFVLILEIWIILGRPSFQLGIFEHGLASASIIIYVSYIVGFCARQVSFYVAEQLAGSYREFRAGPSHFLRHAWRQIKVRLAFWRPTTPQYTGIPYGTSRWGEAFYSRKATLHNYDLLKETFGRDKINDALSKHPIALHLQDAMPANRNRKNDAVSGRPPSQQMGARLATWFWGSLSACGGKMRRTGARAAGFRSIAGLGLQETEPVNKVDKAPLENPIAPPLQDAGSATADFHEVFHYCKIWLRVNAPALSTESMEIEFNLQLSIVPPVLLMPFAISKLTGRIDLLWIGLGFAVVCAFVMYRRGNHLRHAEAFNVLRNIAIAQWCSDTRLGNSPVTQGDAVDVLNLAEGH